MPQCNLKKVTKKELSPEKMKASRIKALIMTKKGK